MAHIASENPPSSIRSWLAERALRRVFGVATSPAVVNVDEDDIEDANGPPALSEPEQRRLVCVGCRAPAPETHTAHTLIGSKHAWRVLRRPERKGPEAFEWRCPRCWAAFKAPRGG